MFKNRATIRTGFGCERRRYYGDCPASVCSFAFQLLPKVTPTGVHNAFGQMPVAYHILNLQIFYGYQVVLLNQVVSQCIQKILALIGYFFVMRLQLMNRLAPIRAALFTTRYPPLQKAKFGLSLPVPFGVLYFFTSAGRDETGNTQVYTHSLTRWREWLSFYFAGKTSKPFTCPTDDTQGFDDTFKGSMPAYSQATNEGQFQASSIQSESVSFFFVPKAIESISAFETGIARSLACLDPTKESSKGFVQIGGSDL